MHFSPTLLHTNTLQHETAELNPAPSVQWSSALMYNFNLKHHDQDISTVCSIMAAVPIRNHEFTPEERLWLALEWHQRQLTGRNFQMIHLFPNHFPGKAPPASASTLGRMHAKLMARNTTNNCRKGNSGRRKTVDTAFNCAWMEAIILFEMNNVPGDVMNSARFVTISFS